MPRGGAAAGRVGPAPDPNALRRSRDDGEWSTLPSAGRPGPPPKWPLTKATARELEFWVRLWAKPQAIKWEEQGQDTEVALYVRRLMAAEKRDAPAAVVTNLRQLADSLGLTTPGMRFNRWRIAKAPEVVEGGPLATVEPIEPSRERLKVVAADAVEGA